MKQGSRIALGLAVGVGLVALLVRWADESVARLLQTASTAQLAVLVAVLLSVAAHCWITSIKWRLVTAAVEPQALRTLHFFSYSVLINLLAQALPMQVATVAGRAAAMRLHATPVVRGTVATVYEQAFDVLVPVLLIPPALLALAHLIALETALAASAVLLVLGNLLLARVGADPLPKLLHALARVPFAPLQRALLRARVSAVLAPGAAQVAPASAQKLFFWSELRYLNLMFRTYLVAQMIHPSLGLGIIACGMSIIALTAIISLTPANLGITELGWVGTLGAFGIPADVSVAFALLTRLLTVAALLVLSSAVALGLLREGTRDARA